MDLCDRCEFTPRAVQYAAESGAFAGEREVTVSGSDSSACGPTTPIPVHPGYILSVFIYGKYLSQSLIAQERNDSLERATSAAKREAEELAKVAVHHNAVRTS